ncbi:MULTISPECIES: 50S ribosomal protein L33 [Holzapfeliella]|uniref:Large ribosomal subunit protein bL33 n=1 Tax=Holzapfeliella saturejae TaxID=3082953 RepID=A0ABU8SGN8_9LACO
MRQNILLECAETGERLYLTNKNKRNNPERLEFKKYSPKKRQRMIFKETK